jgi:hypothetical protein
MAQHHSAPPRSATDLVLHARVWLGDNGIIAGRRRQAARLPSKGDVVAGASDWTIGRDQPLDARSIVVRQRRAALATAVGQPEQAGAAQAATGDGTAAVRRAAESIGTA